MKRYSVFGKSIKADPWGDAIMAYDNLFPAEEFAYELFETDGWYSIVVDNKTGRVVFEDYHYVG